MAKFLNDSLLRSEAVQRVKQGEFKNDLAREYGVSVATLYEWTKGVPQTVKRPSTQSNYYSEEVRERAIQLLKQGTKQEEVAEELGVSLATLHEWKRKTGMEMKNKPYPESVRAEVISRVQNGETKQQVAQELKLAKSVVTRWTKGIGNSRPTYSQEEKAAAIERVSTGEQKAAVANDLGVSVGTLHNWTKAIKRKRYLTKEMKEEVVRRSEDGESKAKVARDLGIHRTTVRGLTSHVKPHNDKPAVKENFIARVKMGESPVPLARSFGVALRSYHRWRLAGELDIPISPDLRERILDRLKKKESIFKIALDLQAPVHQLRLLKRQAEGKTPHLPNKLTYSEATKIHAVQAVAAGVKIRDVAKKIGASYAAVLLWVKEASAQGTISLPVVMPKLDDLELSWITNQHPEAENWRKPLSEWLRGEATGVGHKIASISNFVGRYLSLPAVPKTMAELFQRGAALPSFYNELVKVMAPNTAIKQHNTIRAVVDWILLNYFSEQDDDDDAPRIAIGYRNPFAYINLAGQAQIVRDESVRDVMPYGYIVELREKLAAGPTFGDWKLAQTATGFETASGSTNAQTDWFKVSNDRIDKTDPNCVWRIRKRLNKPPVLEMWSPVRWVAVLVKLQTVARTGMVRMLDSGESDTWRYENNTFVLNTNPLAQFNRNKVWQQGVFRRNPVDDPRQSATLYFNTNKTKDVFRSGADKGHLCPWPMFDGISDNPYYWLEALRNWQEKYNSIDKRTSWGEIPANRSIAPKSEIAKASYPDTCFLFRTPEDKGREHLPVANTVVDKAWRNLLKAFDVELANKGVTHEDGSPVRLFQVTEGKTKFPLHGLRVSLITSMVIDGKVPPELMMKIVGHSRLVMLLYYTKPGFTTLRDALSGAAEQLDRKKEASIIRFLSDSKEEEILDRVVFNAEDWRTVIPVNPAHRNPVGWLLMHDGICLAGGNTSPLDGDAKRPGCHNGGPLRKASAGEYDPVSGGQMNCSRCRWKAAEKRHGPGLVATFNNQAYHLRQVQEAALKHSREVTDLKKEKARVEASGTIFTKMGGLKMAERLYESSMVKLSDFAASMAETFKLIERVKQLPDVPGDGMALAVVGDSMTMHALLEETDSELLQLSGICGDVELYPDLSPGTAVYRRSQIYDAALKREGMPPFFMQLTEDEQLTFGNAFIKKLAETANPSCPLLGIREVISTMDAGNSIEELLGVRLPDLLPSTPYEAANIAKLKIPKGRPYAQD